jgi:hypothetical protein
VDWLQTEILLISASCVARFTGVSPWHPAENIYFNKQKNLEEKENFLDLYDLPKLTQEGINHLNGSAKSNKTEKIIKYFPTKKTQDQMDLLVTSNTPLKKK